jgi:hypothetical protein
VVVVVGGGCFGSFHTRQLLKAIRSGRLASAPLVVVDRNRACTAAREFAGVPEVTVVVEDWLEFLGRWLPRARPGDRLVPAPLAPHLVWEWMAGELGATPTEAPMGWGLPYEMAGSRGELFLSAAAWTCPATCVEPSHCPVLHAPRDWDLADVIERRATALGFMPAVFRCLHLAGGVGALRVEDLLASLGAARQPTRRRILVATSSRCHAAVGALALAGSADAKLGADPGA